MRVTIISRSAGKNKKKSKRKCRSAAKKAAYISGEKIYCAYTDKTYFYPRKHNEVIHKEIFLPDNAPEHLRDRTTLWNEVERTEPSKHARLAREIRIALQCEFSREQNIALAQRYCQALAERGMAADLCIHDKGDKNIHAHILLTTRPFNKDKTWGLKARKEYILNEHGEKIRLKSGEYKSYKVPTTNWDRRETYLELRHLYQDITNEEFEKAGLDTRICVDSFEQQGLDREPTKYLGPYRSQLERLGIRTEVGDLNRDIQARNALRATFTQLFDTWIEEAKARLQLEAEQLQLLQQKVAEWEASSQVVLTGAAQFAAREEQTELQLVFSDEKKERVQQDTPPELTYHCAKYDFFKPNGWLIKTGKDWQSKRLRQQLKQAQQRQVTARDDRNLTYEPEPKPAYHKAKRKLFQPTGWRVKAQKDWQSKRKQLKEQKANPRLAQKLEQEKVQLRDQHQGTKELTSEKEHSIETPDSKMLQQTSAAHPHTPNKRARQPEPEHQASLRNPRARFQPNGWRVKAKKDWPSVRARLKKQFEASGVAREQSSVFVLAEPDRRVGFGKPVPLLKQEELMKNRSRLAALQSRLAAASCSWLMQETKQMREKYQGVSEKVVCLDTMRQSAQEGFQHQMAQVGQALARQAELLCAIEQIGACATTRQEIPETIMQQLASLSPLNRADTRPPPHFQRGEGVQALFQLHPHHDRPTRQQDDFHHDRPPMHRADFNQDASRNTSWEGLESEAAHIRLLPEKECEASRRLQVHEQWKARMEASQRASKPEPRRLLESEFARHERRHMAEEYVCWEKHQQHKKSQPPDHGRPEGKQHGRDMEGSP
jgi:hypothetical protein